MGNGLMAPRLILASESPRRRELLAGVTAEFFVVASYAAECSDASIGPGPLCEVNARRKALAVAERYPDDLVLAADTLVFLDRKPLGKPVDLAEAASMLRSLAGRTHEVITGVCLVHLRGARMRVFSEVTRVKFLPFDAAVIGAYLAAVPVLDKAGAYALQDRGEMLVDRVEGSASNVIGCRSKRCARCFGNGPLL
jgi:septum formation protein